MSKRNFIVLSLAVVAVLLTACGGSEGLAQDTSVEVAVSEVEAEDTVESSEAGFSSDYSYPVVDTEQVACYDNSEAIECPESGDFYGQDAQIDGNAQSYTVSITEDGDETVTDNVTGLIWTKSPDLEGIGNNDGEITSDDKLSSSAAASACDALNYAGYTDWQLPNIKQLYSLMNFKGQTPLQTTPQRSPLSSIGITLTSPTGAAKTNGLLIPSMQPPRSIPTTKARR